MHFNILTRLGLDAGRDVVEEAVDNEDGVSVHQISLSDEPPMARPSCGEPGAVHGEPKFPVILVDGTTNFLIDVARSRQRRYYPHISLISRRRRGKGCSSSSPTCTTGSGR